MGFGNVAEFEGSEGCDATAGGACRVRDHTSREGLSTSCLTRDSRGKVDRGSEHVSCALDR
ncbi:hypothetical protein GCM10009606_07400 [Nocardioides aquiterrae]|uniref:Uncharacterized protein n=1 Tax=Nocardioides aquiterrae TaxID=203799 RepID=A0ABN1U940_9ACTN